MASLAIYDAIRTHLETNWTATPLVFENEGDPPGAGVHWLHVEMEGQYFGRESIGAGSAQLDRWDEEGGLWLRMMCPAGAGTRIARGHLSNLGEVFRGLRLLDDKLEFLDAQIGFGESVESSSSSDGNWYMLTMKIEWRLIDA